MPALLIKDFLQTQGLKLPADEIHVAYLTAQAVIKMGNASVERSILWPSEDGWQLADYVDAEHELLLKQIFMALDSVAERTEHLKSAAVYTAFPKDGALSLVRLSRWGVPLENVIPIDEQAGRAFLAVRTAQSGWMNVCQNVAYWQEIGELSDERNHPLESDFLFLSVCPAVRFWVWCMPSLMSKTVRLMKYWWLGLPLPWLCRIL